MSTKEKKVPKHRKRHLTPLEVQAIADARAKGVRVVELAATFQVSRQTIYNAIQAVKEGRVSTRDPADSAGVLPARRRRSGRISPEVKAAIVALKQKYPEWGVDYLRDHWIREGGPALSRGSIYRILRGAGLLDRPAGAGKAYRRFEMTRPGQLYQMDFQGEIYLPNVGWVHGCSVIDDFSRYVVAYRYYTEATLNNAILTLQLAIERYGVPEAVYVDHGSQFVSSGERMNNFQLFCAAHGTKVVMASRGRPEGKGKVERLHQTVERQFVSAARVRMQEDPAYGLAEMNRDLDRYFEERYNRRVHGGTKEVPATRFFSGSLQPPSPQVDFTRYLERDQRRTVNKFGEVSFQGFKIQVDVPAHARVRIVETLETVRVEHGGRKVREVHKHDLSREVPVSRQDGVGDRPPAGEAGVETPVRRKKAATRRKKKKEKEHRSNKADGEGFYHRRVNQAGILKVLGVSYYFGQDRAGLDVLVKIVGNRLHVHGLDKSLLARIDVRLGVRY